jgi:molybdopterin molybdotransferase
MLFLKPAIFAMQGLEKSADTLQAKLLKDLPPNDDRQDYLRARTEIRSGERHVEAFAVQDSSMLKVLADADALIVRAPHAPAAKTGEYVEILALF